MRVKKYQNTQKNSTEIYNSAVKDAKIHLVTRANGFSSIDQTAASLLFPDPRSGRNWARNKGHVQLMKLIPCHFRCRTREKRGIRDV